MDISMLFHNILNLLLQTQLILEFPNILNTKQGRTLGTNYNRGSKGRAGEKNMIRNRRQEDRVYFWEQPSSKLVHVQRGNC